MPRILMAACVLTLVFSNLHLFGEAPKKPVNVGTWCAGAVGFTAAVIGIVVGVKELTSDGSKVQLVVDDRAGSEVLVAGNTAVITRAPVSAKMTAFNLIPNHFIVQAFGESNKQRFQLLSTDRTLVYGLMEQVGLVRSVFKLTDSSGQPIAEATKALTSPRKEVSIKDSMGKTLGIISKKIVDSLTSRGEVYSITDGSQRVLGRFSVTTGDRGGVKIEFLSESGEVLGTVTQPAYPTENHWRFEVEKLDDTQQLIFLFFTTFHITN